MPAEVNIPPRTGIPPVMVAVLRAALEAGVLAAIGVIIVQLTAVTTGELAPFAPVGVAFLRVLEGIVDQRIDPTTQRVTGGTPA